MLPLNASLDIDGTQFSMQRRSIQKLEQVRSDSSRR
jgi:hypothetical protein